MGSFLSYCCCCCRDPADEYYRSGSQSFQQYLSNNMLADLHEAIRNFQTCLDLHLETREILTIQGKAEPREFSQKMAETYRALCMAVLSRYYVLRRKEDLDHIKNLDLSLFREWAHQYPNGYAAVLINCGTAYSWAYMSATQVAFQQLHASDRQLQQDDQDLWPMVCDRFKRVLQLQDGVGGMTTVLRCKASMELAATELQHYQYCRTIGKPNATALNDSISHFRLAVQFFSRLAEDDPYRRENYAKCLKDLATAHYKRYLEGIPQDPGDLDQSIVHFKDVLHQFETMQPQPQDNDMLKRLCIECLHSLATAFYKRYTLVKDQHWPQLRYLTVPNAALPQACLLDLEEARKMEDKAKGLLGSFDPGERTMLGLNELYADVNELMGVLIEHQAAVTPLSSRPGSAGSNPF
ncbi:hypothetical protein D9613_011636 [Agrocybe pediades]|uniref:Uncharacterized protein n=1 Tax=Agrocybe pediades TaxID=84607 RepID=A0A8H4VQB6_9AGAR|nr:hypothetical protein D9613_011636 [Agrocybe pediades]